MIQAVGWCIIGVGVLSATASGTDGSDDAAGALAAIAWILAGMTFVISGGLGKLAGAISGAAFRALTPLPAPSPDVPSENPVIAAAEAARERADTTGRAARAVPLG